LAWFRLRVARRQREDAAQLGRVAVEAHRVPQLVRRVPREVRA
jgi:hypothetical protein